MSNGISLKGIVAPNGTVHHVDHEYLDNNPPIPEADETLSIPGKYADAKAAGDALDALKEDLSNITGVTVIGGWSAPSRTYYDLSESPANQKEASSSGGINDWQYVVVPCNEGDIFTVSGTGGSRPRAWGFVDGNYDVLMVETASVNAELKQITAPSGSVYLILNKRTSVTDKESYCGALIPSFIDGLNDIIDGIHVELDKALTLSHTYASNISDNTDYDTLTTAGNYYVSTASHAKTMTHCPVTVAHRLIVLTAGSGSQIKQIVIAHATKMPIWVRNNTEDWHKLSIEDTALTQQTSFVTGSANLPFTDCNDAPVNTVYTINGSAAVDNLPQGNYNVAGAEDTYGTVTGTLITIGGAVYNDGTNITQFYMAQATSPETQSVLSFRSKFYSNSVWTWTPWTKIAGYGFLRATNTFIQESRIQAGTAMFSDMNDAPNNTIVQIDLDAVSMANNPLTGHSCVLITLCPSYISRHGMLQLCSGITGGSTLLYFRYGYKQSVGNIVWMPWKQVMPVGDGEPLLNKGRLENGSNFNDIADNSIYMLGANGGYDNNPIDTHVGFLTTKTVDTITMQTCERLNGDTYTRYTTDGGSTWSNWTQH